MDPFQPLPSYDDLVRRFSLFGIGSSACDIQIGEGGSLCCDCHGCTDWHAFVGAKAPYSGDPQYEVFTREHLLGLAQYLRSRAKIYGLSVMEVLEVGAGSGRLNYHLGLLLRQLENADTCAAAIHLTATDSGLRGLNGATVRKEEATEAVTRAKPHMVIASWMPMLVDWTSHMRASGSVLEYILIGETDGGICGHPVFTWGLNPSPETSDDEDSHTDDKDVPSNNPSRGSGSRRWSLEGWVGVELTDLSQYQVCRTDERWSTTRHSRTVSFRRHSPTSLLENPKLSTYMK